MDAPSPSDKCELPRHIPIDMGIAPMKQPYEHQHTLHIGKESNESSHLAQHSLSPEKLGVVGYVRDVAGFVKDAVHDVKQKHHSSKSNNSNNNNNDQITNNNDQQQQEDTSSSSTNNNNKTTTTTTTTPQPIPNQHHQSTPLADIVTSLFPNVGNSPKDNSPPPCTHAESLRENMMEQINYSKEHRLL